MIGFVAGFGRCGTSLTMAMLQAGGLPVSGSETVFENAGANAGEHVLAGVLFKQDVVDAAQVQELGQHQPRGAAADDADLGFSCGLHAVLPFGREFCACRLAAARAFAGSPPAT